MKIARTIPAEPAAALAIAATATLVFVLPPMAGLGVAAALAALPLLAWLFSSSVAWLALFLGAVLILPPLPAGFGNSGAHPALAVVLFGLYAALVFAGNWRAEESTVIAPLSLLTLLLAISISMALLYSGAAIALGSAVRVALFAIAPFVLLYVVWGPGRSLASYGFAPAKLLFAAGVASALFACVDFFYQLPAPAGYSPQFIWLTDRILRRAQGIFYDAGALGNMCCFFLAMVAVAMFRPGKPLHRWWIGVGAVPLLIALVFSYSRASVVTVGVSLAALLWLQRAQVRWWRAALVAVGCAAAVAALAAALAPGLWERWFLHAQQSLTLDFSASDAVLSGRVSSWKIIFSFMRQHPLMALAGVGYKTLPYTDLLGQPVIADNTYLSTLIETGAAGLAALCALHVSILRMAHRAARSTDATTAFYGSWVFCFWVGEAVQMAAADLLTYWRLLPVFFFVIGLTILHLKRTDA